MIKKKTVFVIGAGGSNSYGFPTGKQLIESIRANLINDVKKEELRQAGIKDDEIKTMQSIIEAADKNDTIDRIIELKTKDNPIGEIRFSESCRALIAQALIPYEDESKLTSKSDWYETVFKAMAENVSQEQFCENKIHFVTFNYDRSFDHKLFLNVKKKYGLNNGDTSKIMENFKVNHLYFRLGFLDWENNIYGKVIRNYSPNYVNSELRFAAAQFHTISEQKENKNFRDAQENAIKEAENIYFLGFGFDETNFKRLNIPEINKDAQLIATCLGKDSTEIERINKLSENRLIYKQNLLECATDELLTKHFPLND